jgi:type II secretory ATPase GspE/PulE/Tfp pilus assembly ATPase PilB-like protein
MDISEQNHVQDGKIFMQLNVNGEQQWVNLRVSTLPTLCWENIVIRILLTSTKFGWITTLGFSKNIQEKLLHATQINEWLILVCGGTGSWKTTTLYAMLNEYDPQKKAIFTLENPVEYTKEGYVQSQIHIVNGDAKSRNSYTFWEWLIGILRQDPDVIMIWEMRRKEETETCLEAANTGHIVMGSIHANNSLWVIARIRQFEIPSYLIASSLKYIVCQKMVRLLCPHCRIWRKLIVEELPVSFKKHLKAKEIPVCEANNKWCDKCNNWYCGRTVLAEVVHIDENMYKLILDNVWEDEMKRYLIKQWWVPIYIEWLKKAIAWNISIGDLLKLDV